MLQCYPQLSPDVYSSMSRLLQPLATLSQQHPEVFIQELASNLRAVIATHGACHLTSSAFSGPKDSNRTPTNDNLPSKKRSKIETKTPQTCTPSPLSVTNKLKRSHIKEPTSSEDSVAGETSHSSKAFSDWLLEACHPDVPTRAFALRKLTQMVQSRDQEIVQAQEKVLIVSCVFLIFFSPHLVSAMNACPLFLKRCRCGNLCAGCCGFRQPLLVQLYVCVYNE